MMMMRLLSFIFLFVVLAAQPASAEDQRDRILLLDLKATLIGEEVVGIITNMVSAELSNYEEHFEIITNADMRQMVALEAEKQGMGCSNDSSCLAELAGAMGARFVMWGEVGKLGKNIIITFNLFDSHKAKAAGRAIVTLQSLDLVPEKVPPAIAKLLKRHIKKKTDSVSATATPPVVTPPAEAPKIAKAPPAPAQTPTPAPAAVEAGPSFPWLAVSALTLTAVASGGAVILYGLPSYETTLTAQKAYLNSESPTGSPETILLYDAAGEAQTDFWSGPAYVLIGGAIVALASASGALYMTGTALDGE